MAALLLPQGRRSVVVVTAPMHTRRACAVFEAVGFAVACHETLEHEHVTARPVTARDRLATFRDFFYEQLAMAKYRWMGWLDRGAGVGARRSS